MDRHEILERINNADIPDLPPVIKEVFTLLKSPSTLDMQLLVSKITSYGELKALILSKFNNGYFRRRHNVETIQEGIKYFGLQTLQNILLYLIIRSLSSKIQDKTGFHRTNYWKHCLGSSIIAHNLAINTGLCDPYLMFSYGLIHDIGISVIEYSLPELIFEIREVQKRGITHIIAERTVMDGITHEDIGLWLCNKWELPDEIGNIVAFHHRPKATSQNAEEVLLFYKADILSTIYYESLMGINPFIDKNRIIASLNLEPQVVTKITEQLPEEVQKAREIFNF